MKKIFGFILIAGLSLGLTSCDKFFDNMEGDLSKVQAEDLMASNSGFLALLANLYSNLPDMSMSSSDQNTMFANGSRSTPAYGDGTTSFWSYSTIRSVHKFMEAVEQEKAAGRLDETTADAYLGEGRFLRACFYFASVRAYGGIPILDHLLDDEPIDSENLYIPRSTEKESWDWVIAEFQAAADMMPERQDQAMRANKYTALAMKARAALWAASESKYWDRAPLNGSYTAVQKKLTYMEASYADAYYTQAIDAAEAVIKSGKYELAGTDPANIDAAVGNLIALFQNYDTKEGIFGRSYKNGSSDSGNGNQGWGPNQVITGYLQGTYSVTLNLADEYDYYDGANTRARKDGKIQTLVDGDENAFLTDESQFTAGMVANYRHYDSVDEPFKLKDARFQAWVCYPGSSFRGTTINNQGGMVMPDGTLAVYPGNNNAVNKNGVDYFPYGGPADENSFFYKLDKDINDSNRSFYCFQLRKGLDESGNNPNPQTPWYNIRYSEILLTYAEAVVESGKGDAALAAKCLNDVRHRAGFKDDVALTIENVLHEWKCEFAFENQWSHVLHRRRGFITQGFKSKEEGDLTSKLTLIPLADLSGTTAQWIFVRCYPYNATAKQGYSGFFNFKADDYYQQIPNYVKNRIEPNNKQQ